jgi:GT2 family glycosyltransferase
MRIAAITVNWNQAQLTQECVKGLAAGSQVPVWILVVDNGSRVDPTAMVRAAFPDTIVMRNDRNLGFAAGVNVGIERALLLGAEAVLIVNNDAVVAPVCVAELAAALETDRTLAGVGAKTLTQEQPPRIHTAYGILTYHGQLVRQQGWLEPDTTQFNTQRPVDYISGCAMLLRRSALERVGLLDAEFFAYHEDLDWCTRARRAGYGVAYVPAAMVYHRMHASTGGGGYLSPITYLSARNSILFVRKNASWSQRLKFAFYLCGNLLKEGTWRYRRGELAGFTLRLRGLRDGLLRRPVPVAALGLAEPADSRVSKTASAAAVGS